MKKPNLINSKTVFTSTLIVVPTLALIIYSTGIPTDRTIYLNSLLFTTILSIVFFLFITIGLYNGWKLKDRLGNFLDKFHHWKKPSSRSVNVTDLDLAGIEVDGIEGCIISILIWIIVAFLGSFILWTLGAILWITILTIFGILYWIIFRAYRLIFMNSTKCKGKLLKSLSIAMVFTILYNFWIYAIIVGVHFLNR